MGGINHYQYAPNPVNWVDPFGLSCKESVDKSSDLLQQHLDSLPLGSYEVIGFVDRPNQGFTNNKAVKIKLLEALNGHRFSGGGSNPAGPYVAIGDMPSSRYDVRQKLALKSFGRNAYNSMRYHTNVLMDKGTVLYLGEVAPQTSKGGKHYIGGGTQAFVEFWQPENKGKVKFSKPIKMPRHKIVTK